MKKNGGNFNVTKQERITAEMNQIYNERFEALYNLYTRGIKNNNNVDFNLEDFIKEYTKVDICQEEDLIQIYNECKFGKKQKNGTLKRNKLNIDSFIRKYKNNDVLIADEDLRQIVLNTMWEVAKKETTKHPKTKEEIPMKNRLHYFRGIVNFRLQDQFRYGDKTKGKNQNKLLGQIRKYKSSKEERNETYTEQDILDVFEISKEKYEELMIKINYETTLSLDYNNGTSEDGEISFYDNHGANEEGYEIIEQGWDSKEEKMKYQDENPYEMLEEAYRIVFPKNKNQANFQTLIRIYVNNEKGIDIAKEEGIRNTSISERIGETHKNADRILEAYRDIKKRRELGLQ